MSDLVPALSPGRPASGPPGFLEGAASVWFGINFIIERPALWRHALVPVAAAVVLTPAGGALGGTLGYWLSKGYLNPGSGSGLGVLVVWALIALCIVLGLAAGSLLGLSLALPVSGSALETIARAVLAELGLEPPALPAFRTLVSSVGSALLGLLCGSAAIGLLLMVSLFIPVAAVVAVPVKLIILSLMVTWDVGDYPFSCWGMELGRRSGWVRDHLWASVGFGCVTSLLLCIPVVGLLVVPAAVAGMARLHGLTLR